MPPYLNVCGQGGQKSKFWAKNIVFCPKMDIFSGPKIFKSGSAVPPHRVLSNEVSHDHSSMYMVRLTKNRAKGGQKGPKRGQKGPKRGQQGAKKFLPSLNTIKNALKCRKKRKK